MAVKSVLMLGNPKLREKSTTTLEFGMELREILKDLRDTLTHLQKTKRIGRALAAPQIGCMRKVVYVQTPERAFVLVNPKIVSKSKETFEVWDSCFSFNVSFFVKIRRHRTVKVRYQDESGKPKTEEFTGGMSELMQHEIDHLHGILATDYLKDVKQIIMREEWEKRCAQ
ncbi:MAG: peptide deformylase [Candidatus Altiarchaeota archaeon]